MQEPEQVQRRVRRSEVGGIGVGRLFVPWSSMALALVIAFGLAGIVLTGGTGDEPALEIDTAAAGEIGDDGPAEITDHSSITTTTGAPAPGNSGSSTTATTRTKKSPTTATTNKKTGPPSTTVTTQPGNPASGPTSPTQTTATTTPTTVTTAPKAPTVVLDRAGMEGAGHRIWFRTADFGAYPGLRVHFRYWAKGEVNQYTAVFGEARGAAETVESTRVEDYQALFELTVAEMGTQTSNPPYGEFYHGMVAWEWDGGTHTVTPGTAPQITMTLVRADLCSGGSDCYGYRFKTDRHLDRLSVWFRVDRDSEYQQGIVEHSVFFEPGKTVATAWYPAAELNFDDGDPIPGFEGVTHVGWQGGSTDGSKVKICGTAAAC